MSEIKSALVIGACGGFGRAFTQLLSQRGVAVTGVDLPEAGSPDVALDLLRVDAPTELLNRDMVLMCVAEPVAKPLVQKLSEQLPAGVLLVDICSVKSPITAIAADHATQCEYVSLHPMFGPHNAFAEQNMVFIPVRSGPRSASLKTLLEECCGQLIESDADAHDRMTAYVQAAAHAALACFASLRDAAELDTQLEQAFATPIYRALAQASQDLVGHDADLYHNIQTANPHAEAARQKFGQAVAETLPQLADTDVAVMSALFERLRNTPFKP